jgi:hypothetical protein
VGDALESSVERARISPNGSLGAFGEVASMTHAHSGGASVVIGNTLYVLGGETVDVEAAELADDTDLRFAVVPGLDVRADASNGEQRQGAATAVIGDFVCLFGGKDKEALRSNVCAQIAPDGSLDELAATKPLAAPRAESSSVMVGTQLYLLGGFENAAINAPLPSVIRVEVDSVSSFDQSDEPALGTPRQYSASVVVGNSICVIGGGSIDEPYMASTECAAFAMSR